MFKRTGGFKGYIQLSMFKELNNKYCFSSYICESKPFLSSTVTIIAIIYVLAYFLICPLKLFIKNRLLFMTFWKIIHSLFLSQTFN